MAKTKKKRADKYDTKLAINGSFDDVIKVSVTPGKLLINLKKRQRKNLDSILPIIS